MIDGVELEGKEIFLGQQIARSKTFQRILTTFSKYTQDVAEGLKKHAINELVGTVEGLIYVSSGEARRDAQPIIEAAGNVITHDRLATINPTEGQEEMMEFIRVTRPVVERTEAVIKDAYSTTKKALHGDGEAMGAVLFEAGMLVIPYDDYRFVPKIFKDINWSWKSKKTFGHTFTRHGQGRKLTSSLMERAKASNQSSKQGQWLNNKSAAEWIKSKVEGGTFKANKPYEFHDLPDGLGQVIDAGGGITPTNSARIIINSSGKITSYPIN